MDRNQPVQTEEPLRRLTSADVVTVSRTHRNATVEQYPYWTQIHTSREETDTEPHIWVPNVNIERIR